MLASVSRKNDQIYVFHNVWPLNDGARNMEQSIVLRFNDMGSKYTYPSSVGRNLAVLIKYYSR